MIRTVADWEIRLKLAIASLPDIDAAGEYLEMLGYMKDRQVKAIRDSQLSTLDKLDASSPDIRAVICWQTRGLLGGLQFLFRFLKAGDSVPFHIREEIVQACKETIALLEPNNQGHE